ncbi:MAG: FAD-dependent oxidoreductase [Archaeoglobus sp.]|uniref:FAD-dependent oxidoreductase n=1 Tax=Archaeoglobus sp. TaxID=1872626 RepID=UPI001DFFC269|nr:FAD-dependent oxidoreductase [Archaeoglobus sp.]MBO8178870.1 FAD-dependent oxidoreductase [Archaeoglobus sp.]
MKYDVLIIGGGPAGMVTATTAKKFYPDKSVAIIKKEEKGLVPCGIPYVFSTLGSVEKNIMPTKPAENLGIEFIIDEVTDVDVKAKVVKTKSGKSISYEKLVFATGSTPVIPRIEGVEKEGVHAVSKNIDELKKLHEAVEKAERVVIVGGGFIGVEVGEQIARLGKKVAIVEMMDQLLPAAFDKEFARIAEEELKKLGVELYLNSTVKKIVGNSKVEAVELVDGRKIDADVVILSVGYKPNIELAEKAGLRISIGNRIWTDEYGRTSEKDVFAVGDCSEEKDFFTRETSRVMLASTATFEARIVGANLFSLKVVRVNKGTVGVFSTVVGEVAFGAAGLTEEAARKEGFEVVAGYAESFNRHPSSIPGGTVTRVKLVFAKESGTILGGQVAGGAEVGEMVNMIAMAIQNHLTASEIDTLQIGTHPLLTSAPTMPPLIIAAEDALRKM